MLRLSANLGFLWKGLPLTEGVRRAKKGGFDAVEFHAPYDVPVEEMKAVLAETGLPVAGINTRPGNVAAGDAGHGRDTRARGRGARGDRRGARLRTRHRRELHPGDRRQGRRRTPHARRARLI